MKFSPHNFGHKERRLIYKTPAKKGETPSNAGEKPISERDVLEALIKKHGGSIEAAGQEFAKMTIANAANAIKKAAARQALTEKLQEKFKAETITLAQLTELRKNMPNVEIKITTDDKVEVDSFKKAAEKPTAKPGDNKPKGYFETSKGKIKVTEKGRKAIEQTGGSIADMIKSFMALLTPILKTIKDLVEKVRKFFQELIDDFNYDREKFAIQDKYIDKQIQDEKTKPEFIKKHFSKTKIDLIKVDSELSNIRGGDEADKRVNLEQSITDENEKIVSLNDDIAVETDDAAKKELKKKHSASLKKIRTDQRTLEGLSAKIKRKKILEDRLELIKSVAAERKITLIGVVTASTTAAKKLETATPKKTTPEKTGETNESKKTSTAFAELDTLIGKGTKTTAKAVTDKTKEIEHVLIKLVKDKNADGQTKVLKKFGFTLVPLPANSEYKRAVKYGDTTYILIFNAAENTLAFHPMPDSPLVPEKLDKSTDT